MTHSPQRRALLSALAGAGLAAGGLPQPGAAQSNWPSKPVKIIVGFPPGGLTDAYARMFADQLGSKTGQSVVVENKPGAGAIIAIEAVANSPPDGYTLLMTTTGAVWQNRVLYRKLPYDLDRDLTPVTIFPSGPLVVGLPEKVPVHWNIEGQADQWTTREKVLPYLLITPGIMAGMVLLGCALE